MTGGSAVHRGTAGLDSARSPALGAGVLDAAAIALLAAAMLAGCASYRTAPPDSLALMPFAAPAASGPVAGETTVRLAERTFAAAIWASAQEPSDEVRARRAYGSGVAMLTLQCEAYLHALGAASQRASNERKQVGLTGGFASAIMGLAGAAAKGIAGVATTFAFAASSMDAASTTFLFTDASKSVGDLVRSAQGAYTLAAAGRMDGLGYSEAVVLLTGFSDLCQPAKIRALIDEAISAATIVAETPGQLSAQGEVQATLFKLTERLGRRVEEAEAIELYAWLTASPAERPLVAGRSNLVQALTRAPATQAGLADQLSPVFAPLALRGNVVAARWAPAAAQLKAPAPPAAGASPPVAGAPASAPASAPARALYSAPLIRVFR